MAWLALPAFLSATVTARAALADGIKAIVHDSIITIEQVEQLTDPTADTLRRRYTNEPEEYRKKMSEARAENLNVLLRQQLILQDFNNSGYTLPDSVIDDLVRERLKAVFGDRRTATKTLQAQGITYEEFRKRERDTLIVRLMREKNLSQEKIIISPHKVESYYQKNHDKYQVEEEIQLRTIVISKPSGEGLEQARKAMDEIMTKLKEGVPFAEMASTYSQAAERAQGGTRAWEKLSSLRPELLKPVSALKAGEFSEPIDTPDSFWIVQLADRHPAHTKALNEVRDEIEHELSQQEKDRLEAQWIERLKKKTFVRYF